MWQELAWFYFSAGLAAAVVVFTYCRSIVGFASFLENVDAPSPAFYEKENRRAEITWKTACKRYLLCASVLRLFALECATDGAVFMRRMMLFGRQ